MTTESPVIAELQPLLDALCEEMITPEQLQRLETLVLSHPEAERHYIQCMSLHANIIGHVVGRPASVASVAGLSEAGSSAGQVVPGSQTPATEAKAKFAFSRRTGKMIAWSLLVVLVGGLITQQGFVWNSRIRALRAADAELAARQERFDQIQADDDAARKSTRQEVDSAFAAEVETAKQFIAAHDAAKKAIEAKPYTVRITGPEHIQPGAPNKWQIETLRRGAVGRPQKLDVIVKDSKDKELWHETHERPAGAATLELNAAFWSKVDPGTELFMEVVAHDDNNTSVLAERLPLARPVYVTHLVTDKPLYKPGETIRFRSLTLNRSTLRPPEHEMHLLFTLRDPGNSVVPIDEGNGRLLSGLKPVLGPDNKPLRGIGVGEFVLPEEAPGGEYKLDLYEVGTDGKQVLLEMRKFIVNRYVPDVFEKKLEFDGKSYGPGQLVQARIDVSRTAGGPMVNAKANVVASSEGKNFFEQKELKFTTTTDGSGTKTILDVRFTLPPEVFNTSTGMPNATLSVSIQDGSDTEVILRPIPLVTKTLKIDFFPEGGETIAGTPGRVYFMVRTPAGKPADLKGVITDGNNTVAEVATLTDAENPGVNRGQGVFSLTPEAGKKYYLKLTSPSGITEPTEKGYELPPVKAEGIALTALDTVTSKGGTIRVRLQSPTGPKTVHVGAYVRERLIAQQKLVLQANKPVDVSLQSNNNAGGVVRVTVFDAVLEPRAERLVFRESGERLVLHARPDKLRYSPSDKVRLDLAAFNEQGHPTPAVLLVGVTNRSVITMADNKNDRLQSTHFLLSGEVRNSAELEHADFLLTDHPKAAVALDLLLGTQGWRRFAEQEVAPNPADKDDVAQLLLKHGQRSTAPVELLKLERQRVNAEFAPRMETARLRTVGAHNAWRAQPTQFTVQLSEAAAAVAIAAESRGEAQGSVLNLRASYARVVDAVGPPLLAFSVLAFVFILLLWVGSSTSDSTKPAQPVVSGENANPTPAPEPKRKRSSRLITAAVGTALIFLAVLGVITTLGSNAKSTFSFVGSSISPNEPLVLERKARQEAEKSRESERSENEDRINANGLQDSVLFESFHLNGLNDADAPLLFFGNGEARFDDFDKVAVPGILSRSRGRNLFGSDGRAKKYEMDRWGYAALIKDETKSMGQFALSPDFYRWSLPANGKGYHWMDGTFTSGPRAGRYVRDWSLASGEVDEKGIDGLVPIRRRPILPFVAREYAHQRDPSLGEVRSDFTETVYWHPVLVLPESGKTTVEFQLSDDIARYQVLVAGHTLDGRVGAITQTIEARKPFSVDPKLPVEISHTDTINVPLRVTNDSDSRRTVTLKTTIPGFKTTDKLLDSIELAANEKGRKLLRLNADRLNGYANVLIEANSGADKDSISRTIRIVPDGFPRVEMNSDMLENGVGRTRITIPKDLVTGSLRMRLEMYPTTMADLLKGLEGMLQEPYGCFEQTSTTNYPNTLILDYLNQSNQANPEVAKRAKSLLDKGYGRLTSFECPDSEAKFKQGFEWFGKADHQHEALTAYGLLQFKDMARVHAVDPKLIQRTQQFLLSRRDGKGGFTQKGNAYHSWGASKNVVDAYIVWALVESDPDNNEQLDLKKEIAAIKALALDENSADGKDSYFVALVANVLQLRDDRATANKLLDRLKEKNFKDGVVTGAVTSVTRSGGRDLQIETTAMTLLGWIRANDPTYSATIKHATRWLSQQRSGGGGFGSTQSTIMALKALSLYAKKSAHPAEAGELRLSVGGKVIASRKFTERDVEVIALDIPNAEEVFKPGVPTEVEITTDAKHPYPFALAYGYTRLTPESAEQCSVRISTKLAKTEATEGDTVPLSVTLENKLKQGHGMATAIIGIPAGMKVPTDMKQLTDLREKEVISYFEIRGRELVLYWRELAPEQKIALTVDLVCDVPGEYRGPASRGYLYYNADHKHWVEPLAVKIAPMGKE